MPSEWIRPTGCEGGACVEYRTVDGKVFVRNSADLTDNGMLEFTAAEWDTFVVGLTAPIAAELAGAHTIAQRANARAEALAADLSRVRTQLATANDRFAETLRQRDVAIAEAAVLRHRDRRTPEVRHVIEEAETLVAAWLDDNVTAGHGLQAAVQRYWKATETGPKSTLPAEQPPVVAGTSDGLEAQGGAQRGDEWVGRVKGFWLAAPIDPPAPRVWNAGDPEPEGVEKVRDDDGDVWTIGPGGWWTERSGGLDYGADWKHVLRWAPLAEVLPEPAAPTAEDLQAARDQTRADADQMLSAADNDQDPDWVDITEWIRADAKTMVTVTLDNTDGRFVPTEPLTPVPWKGGPCTCDLCETGRRLRAANHPDGEVPEAGRAGEAQEGPCDCAGCAYDECDPPTQERTEGLDAVCLAAAAAYDQELNRILGNPPGSVMGPATATLAASPAWQAAIRAASPLIERAALQAAEQAILNEPRPSVMDTLGIVLAARVVRDMAARTRTP